MKSTNITFLLVLILSSSILPLLAAAQQKQKLTPKDYDLWERSSKIMEGQVSENGEWVYYLIKTERGDSSILRNIKAGAQLSLRGGRAPSYAQLIEENSRNFSSNSKWFAISDTNRVRVLSLKSGKIKSFKGNSFNFIPQTDRLLIADKNDSGSSIWVYDLTSGDAHHYPNVISYQLNKDASRIAIVTDTQSTSQVHILELTGKIIRSRLIASQPQTNFNGFIWNEAGNVLAFVGRPKMAQINTAEHTLYLCDLSTDKIAIRNFTPGALISDTFQKKGALSSLFLLGDGKQLFFEVRESRYPKEGLAIAGNALPKPVQIWGAAALDYPPKEKIYNARYWYAWHSDGFLESLTSNDNPFAIVSGDQKNVLIYNKVSYLPRFKYVNGFVDIYLKKRRTDSIRLLVEKVKDQPSEFMISPTGRYIAYFKQNNWWAYDFEKNTHTCLTTNMNIDWSSDKKNNTGTLPPYGSPGWLENDQALIVFDKYDIWLLTADGKNRKRITNGQQDNITYRINERSLIPSGPGGSDPWFYSRTYNSKKGIFITSVDYDNIENGWWWWTTDKGLEKIITKEKKIDLLSKRAKDKPLLFTEEDFDLSARLVLRQPSGKEEVLYQTNPQQQNYYWGRSKVIRYRTIDGKDLSGALLLPANYDSTKKYPMIVEVYETRAKEAHYYVNPSEGGTEINAARYTADGYFVLFPDISYRLNEPGISAVRCVTAAVQTAIENFSIDKNRIGLKGHSFGGYETAFIISQTNMFATAIAGAAITDVPDFYLDISSFGTNMTRVEEDQFRMNVPFYSEAYSRNSPMQNIDKINTPLLLYTGDGDTNVDWMQSRRFQLALWRLGKKSTMLVYPGENHVLVQDENVKDLEKRIKEWFDYYLKGDAPAEWIKLNMGISSRF